MSRHQSRSYVKALKPLLDIETAIQAQTTGERRLLAAQLVDAIRVVQKARDDKFMASLFLPSSSKTTTAVLSKRATTREFLTDLQGAVDWFFNQQEVPAPSCYTFSGACAELGLSEDSILEIAFGDWRYRMFAEGGHDLCTLLRKDFSPISEADFLAA